MIEGEENCSANRKGQGGEERDGEVSEMDGWTDKTGAAATQQRTRILCKKGREGEQVWLGEAERDPNKGARAKEWRWRTLAVRTGAGMELDLISQV